MQEVSQLENQLQAALMPKDKNITVKESHKNQPLIDSVSEITKGLSVATVSTQPDQDSIEHVPDTATSRVLDASSQLLCSKKHHEAKFKCALCKKECFDKKKFPEPPWLSHWCHP